PARPQTKTHGEARSALVVLADLSGVLLSLPVERALPPWLGEGRWPESEAKCQERAREVIGRRIPAGTPVETAKAVLEKDGFECSFVDGQWGAFLCGQREDPRFTLSWLRTRVLVDYAGGKVTAVEVYCFFMSL